MNILKTCCRMCCKHKAWEKVSWDCVSDVRKAIWGWYTFTTDLDTGHLWHLYPETNPDLQSPNLANFLQSNFGIPCKCASHGPAVAPDTCQCSCQVSSRNLDLPFLHRQNVMNICCNKSSQLGLLRRNHQSPLWSPKSGPPHNKTTSIPWVPMISTNQRIWHFCSSFTKFR